MIDVDHHPGLRHDRLIGAGARRIARVKNEDGRIRRCRLLVDPLEAGKEPPGLRNGWRRQNGDRFAYRSQRLRQREGRPEGVAIRVLMCDRR